KDPDELKDIGDRKENVAIVKELSRKLYTWMKVVEDPILKGALQSPYYRQSMKDFKKAVR
ncbi:MAG: hypothetical protein ACYTEO_11090, partial [Planctomycetota bacterium]